jgi:hypothetical protein
MRYALTVILLAAVSSADAQPAGKFPPDSLINTKVIPKGTPVTEVVGTMRNFTSALGVRCQFCHEGKEGMPLAQFDFASDKKRNKLVARQMMRMLQEINRRLDTLPERPKPLIVAECATCHRGVSRPVPLFTIVQEAAVNVSADSAVRAYRALRERYYGRDAYDFSESALNIAAFRTARAGKPDEGLALLRYNEALFPNSSGMAVFKGNILLMKGDTSAAVAAFREAVRRDSTNTEARNRLQTFEKRR